jgi:hypothetical protein
MHPANLSPDMTRNSITGQVKALTLIIAVQGLIPDRRAGSAENKPAPLPTPEPQIYASAWLRKQKERTTGFEPTEQGLDIPPVEPPADAPPDHGPERSDPTLANRLSRSETQSPTSPTVAPDTRVPFSIEKKPYGSLRLRL